MTTHTNTEKRGRRPLRKIMAWVGQNPEWEFAGFYGDEAKSGTSTKKRDGFNQMIKDAIIK